MPDETSPVRAVPAVDPKPVMILRALDPKTGTELGEKEVPVKPWFRSKVIITLISGLLVHILAYFGIFTNDQELSNLISMIADSGTAIYLIWIRMRGASVPIQSTKVISEAVQTYFREKGHLLILIPACLMLSSCATIMNGLAAVGYSGEKLGYLAKSAVLGGAKLFVRHTWQDFSSRTDEAKLPPKPVEVAVPQPVEKTATK